METEANLLLMEKLVEYLRDFETNLILYTYDSFLFDISKEDGRVVVDGLREILSIFPTKVYFGDTYQDIKDITKTFNSE